MVVARTASASCGERHQAHVRSAVARRLQRAEQAGVLLVGGHDLVARAEVHARPSRRRSPRWSRWSARRRRRRSPAPARSRRAARPAARSGAGSAASPGPRELGVELLARRSHGGGGQRPVGARVEVGDRLEDRELGAQGGGVHRRGTVALAPRSAPRLVSSDGPTFSGAGRRAGATGGSRDGAGAARDGAGQPGARRQPRPHLPRLRRVLRRALRRVRDDRAGVPGRERRHAGVRARHGREHHDARERHPGRRGRRWPVLAARHHARLPLRGLRLRGDEPHRGDAERAPGLPARPADGHDDPRQPGERRLRRPARRRSIRADHLRRRQPRRVPDHRREPRCRRQRRAAAHRPVPAAGRHRHDHASSAATAPGSLRTASAAPASTRRCRATARCWRSTPTPATSAPRTTSPAPTRTSSSRTSPRARSPT